MNDEAKLITGKVTVYCQRGCNITEADADNPWDECASCGAVMTPQYQDDFGKVHELKEDEFE